jgi:hypothetical protein
MPDLSLIERARRQLDATDLVAVTLWGEARAEPIEGIVAVGHVIRNRVVDEAHRWGSVWQDVVLAKRQFSCWIPEGGEANYARMVALVDRLIAMKPAGEKSFMQCWWVARGVMDGMIKDNTRGANHYYAPALLPKPPSWAKAGRMTAEIGRHLFLRL